MSALLVLALTAAIAGTRQCVRSPLHGPRVDKRHCAECRADDLARRRAYSKRRYRQAKRAKLCGHCKRVPAIRGVLCAACSDAHNAKQNSRYLSARAGRQCDDCGAPSETSRCSECSERRAQFPSRQWKHRRRQE